jgi:hypothetical protein
MPNLFTEYLKTNPKLKEQQNLVNFFDDVSDFATNWKSKQFSILPILVSNKSRWALIVVNNQDQVYPFFYNSLNWSGNEKTHDSEKAEVAGQLKPILGNVDNTWLAGTSYNNYVVSEGSNNPDTESNQAYILSSLEKILDLIKSKPEAFKIKSGWNNNDFGNSIQPNSQDIANYKEKNRLGQENTQLKTDLNKWTSTFPNLTPEAVKKIYDQPKEAHTPADLKPVGLPDNWADQLATLKTWTATFGTQKPDEVKKAIDILNQRPNISQADYDKIKGQLEQANKDNKSGDEKYKALETKNKDDLKTIDSLKEQLKTAQEAQKQAEKERDQAKEETKTAKAEGSRNLGDTKLIASKLLDFYKKEIKKRTELFYSSELSLDNNEVNAKYGDKDKSYLDLLTIDNVNFNPSTDPDQVISAFKIVALIVANEKSQERSDKMGKMAKVPAVVKKNNLKYFQRVKENWDLITEKPKKENNPLYVSLIENYEGEKGKINNIIKLWQA